MGSSLNAWRPGVAAGWAAALAALLAPAGAAAQTDYGAIANGNWSNPATWTPGGGPPGAADNAFIGSNGGGALATATVGLTGNQSARDVWLGFGGGTNGTLDLNGFSLTVSSQLVVGFGGAGTLNHGGGSFTTLNMAVRGPNNFSFAAGDSVTGTLQVLSAGTVNTVATGNVTTSALLVEAGSLLNLGANLTLTQDLEVRGTGATPATVDANGFNITARDVFVGRFAAAGQILNRGTITATRDLEVSNNSFALNAGDSVAQTVRASSNGVLTLHANTAAQSMQAFSGGRVNTVATGNLTSSALIVEAGSLLNLGANLTLTQDLEIRGTGATPATVDANGFNITARDIYVGRFAAAGQILNRGTITASRDLEVSNNTFALNAGDSVAQTVRATSNGVLTLHANTAAQSMQAFSGGRVNTVATGNVTTSALIVEAGSLLNLGANLTLTQDLEIRGTGATPATVDANGFNISARDVYVGRFAAAGQILNRGTITATRDLEVTNNAFALNAGDSVAQTVRATSNGVLTLHANTAAQNMQAFSGGRVNTAATGNLTASASVVDANSLLNLGANLALTQDLEIRGTGATAATVDANGFNISARDVYVGRFAAAGQILNRGTITATRDLEVTNNAFALNAGDSVAQTVRATSNGVLTLHANTAAQNVQVISGGTVNTAATGNLASAALVVDAGSLLNLGANLTLTQDLEVRGTLANVATVDANGFNIAVRDLYMGRFNAAGQLTDDGAVSANRLLMDRSTLTLSGANDVFSVAIDLANTSTLIVQQALGELGGLTLGGNTLNIAAGSVMTLNFDAGSTAGLDWAFRWDNPGVGDRVADLTTLVGLGRIVINSPQAASIFDGGDGFTYIGYSVVPEPGTLLLGGLALGSAAAASRRLRRGKRRQRKA